MAKGFEWRNVPRIRPRPEAVNTPPPPVIWRNATRSGTIASRRQRSGRIACFVRHAHAAQRGRDHDQRSESDDLNRLSSGCSEKSTLINAHKKSAVMGGGAGDGRGRLRRVSPAGRAAGGTKLRRTRRRCSSRVQRPRTESIVSMLARTKRMHPTKTSKRVAASTSAASPIATATGSKTMVRSASGAANPATTAAVIATAPPSASGHFGSEAIGRDVYSTRSPSPSSRVGHGSRRNDRRRHAGRPRHHRPLVRRTAGE